MGASVVAVPAIATTAKPAIKTSPSNSATNGKAKKKKK
jgi:hypothetical protein